MQKHPHREKGVANNYYTIKKKIRLSRISLSSMLYSVRLFSEFIGLVWQKKLIIRSYKTSSDETALQLVNLLDLPSIKINFRKIAVDIYVLNTTTVLQYNIFRKTPSVGIHTGMKIKSACYSIQLYNSPNIFYSQDRHFENTIWYLLSLWK